LNPYDIATILERIIASEKRAIDLIFSPDHPPKIIVEGRLDMTPLKDLKTMSAYQVEMLALNLLKDRPRALETFAKTGSVDTSIELESVGRFRVNIFLQKNMPAVIMRAIPPNVPTFENLGLPDTARGLGGQGGGLSLVTGLSGSGKSTTLAAVINQFNMEIPCHIITIEDPIEFVFPSVKCIVHQREVGVDTGNAAEAMAAALRQAPQVIMISRLTTRECIETALEAAENGILVLSTLPVSGPDQAIEHLVNAFPADQEFIVRGRLAQAFRCIVSQRLIPRKDGRGRAAAVSILKSNSRTRNYILQARRDPQLLEDAMRDGNMDGMQTLQMDLERLVKADVIAPESVAQYLPKTVKPAAKPKPPKAAAAPSQSPGSGNRLLELEDLDGPILGLDT